MTPKEQAEYLYHSMSYNLMHLTDGGSLPDECKQCALIAVDAIMNELTVMNYGLQYLNRMAYWNEVKEEIEKL